MIKKTLTILLALCTAATVSAQIYIGKVTTDDELMSIEYNGYQGVCTSVNLSEVQKYTDSEVIGIRVALGSTEISDVQLFLSEDPDPSLPQNNLASANPTSLEAGWNEILFDTPYTLTGKEKELYVGYYFSCASTTERPVLLGTSKSTYGLLMYENGNYGWGWYDESSAGDLAIQLILRGGNIPDYDIALTGLTTNALYYSKGTETMTMLPYLESKGTQAIPGLILSLSIDNVLLGEVPINEAITGAMTAPLELPLSSFGLQTGRHTLTLRVKELTGGVTLGEGTTGDDEVSCTFYTYENSMKRQCSLLEVFASVDAEYYNERLYAPIEEFLATAPNVVPVFIHGNYNEGSKDPLAVKGAEELAVIAAGMKTAPAWGLDRAAILGNTRYIYEYSQPLTAADFSPLLQYANELVPSFATVAMSGSYNENSRVAVFTVKGQCVEDYSKLFGKGALTVMLVEDHVGDQRHVLRKVLTASTGDAITWNEDNGLAFTKEYRSYIDPKWNLGNLRAVAFISKAVSKQRTDMDITNTTFLPFTDFATPVLEVRQTEAATSETYDLSGRRTHAARPGVYIRDGKKFIVR